MKRITLACALALSITSLELACSSNETPDEGGDDGSGGTLGGTGVGGTSGVAGASGGTAGTTGGSGGSSSGASGSATGGASGSSGAAGAGATGGGGTGGAAPGGASSGGAGPGGAGSGGKGGSGGGANAMMNFFVTSDTSETGNLGGILMADMRCQRLAEAVGHGGKIWAAYLSNSTINAIDRIGGGPYYNSAGMLVAMDKAALHARNGDAALFLDERGNRVNGQWSGSPTPNQHDVLTGSTRAGMLSTGNTCGDWMGTTGDAQVGHSDGMGPGMATTGNYPYWNGSHTAHCDDLASTGGAGKLYCFVFP